MTTLLKSVSEPTPPYFTHLETAGPLRVFVATQLLAALVIAEGTKSTMPLHELSQADVDRAFDVADAVIRTNETPDDATPLAPPPADTSAATIAELRAEVATLHAQLDAATAPPAPVTP